MVSRNANQIVQPKKVFFLECSGPQWVSIARKCVDSGVNVSLWTAWSNLISVAKSEFPATIFLDTVDAKLGRSKPQLNESISFNGACERVWRESGTQLLEMLGRFDHAADMSYPEGFVAARRTLGLWNDRLARLQPDLIVFSAPPHVFYDFIVLQLCRVLNIPTLMFQEVPILPPLSLAMTHYETGSEALGKQLRKRKAKSAKVSERVQAALDLLQGSFLDRLDPAEEEARRKKNDISNDELVFLKGRLEQIRSIMKTDAARFSMRSEASDRLVNTASWTKEANMPFAESFDGDYAATRYHFQLLLDQITTLEMQRSHAAITQAELPEGRFVYLPLAGQPERTTCPQAGIFSNQLLIVDALCKYLPSDFTIIVKEHPNQLSPNFFGNVFRPIEFYPDLVANPRVQLVGEMVDSFELIDKATFVATAGGTVGIEGPTRGKHALVFGNPWYRDAPGVHLAHSFSDVETAMDRIFMSPAPNIGDMSRYLTQVEAAGFEGWADHPSRLVPFDHELAADSIFVEISSRLSAGVVD